MTTLARNPKPKTRTIFHSNPVLSRLSKIPERSETNAATYRGIAVKTAYFLLITLVGMVAQLLVKAAMANEPVWQMVAGFICEMLGIFARKTVPVTGTLYAASQGYVISFLVFKVLTGYEYLGLEALLLTVAVIAAMSYLYSSGIIKVNKKFRTVLLSLILGSIGLGVLSFLGSLLPAARPYVQALMQNAGFTIAIDVIGLIIASLFLISDFSLIDDCVREHYPKEYEWSAAFGLVFTVIWIYLKILDLLMQFAGKNKD